MPWYLQKWSSLLLCCLHGDSLNIAVWGTQLSVAVDEGESAKGGCSTSVEITVSREMRTWVGARTEADGVPGTRCQRAGTSLLPIRAEFHRSGCLKQRWSMAIDVAAGIRSAAPVWSYTYMCALSAPLHTLLSQWPVPLVPGTAWDKPLSNTCNPAALPLLQLLASPQPSQLSGVGGFLMALQTSVTVLPGLRLQ